MDAMPPADPPKSEPVDWVAEFKRRMAATEDAAREWGVRAAEPEGRFVSALLGAMRMMGGLSDAALRSSERTAQINRRAAELELARAQEVTKAANIALSQARNAQIALVVEQETVVDGMVNKTLPLFIDKLQGALIIRERRWNDDVRQRRLVIAGLVALGVFLGGYALRAWADSDRTAALGQCLAHPLASQGHIYCDVTSFQEGGS